METSLRKRVTDKCSGDESASAPSNKNHPSPPLLGGSVRYLDAYLSQPVNSLNLAIFRIFFGLMMSFVQYRLVFLQDVLEPNFSYAEINFHFCFARGIPHLALDKLIVLVIISCMAAFCFGIGLFYRISCGIFLITYTYLSLLEKTRYNNHFYLYILLTFFFFITDCHKRLSVDSYFSRYLAKIPKLDSPDTRVPFWHFFLFRFQLFIVYFYAGIAKLNYDWMMRCEPMTIWSGRSRFSNFRKITHLFIPKDSVQDFLGIFFSLGGLFFDLFIGFFLSIPRLRPVGFFLTIFFHLSNHFLFKIGTFPWVMMGTNLIFLNPETISNFITNTKKKLNLSLKQNSKEIKTPLHPGTKTSPQMSNPFKCFLLVYVAIQVLVPFRHWLYPGNVNWTQEGHQFSWRMMLNQEDVIMRIHVNGKEGQQAFDPYQLRLTLRQIKRMLTDPELVLQFVRHIKTKYTKLNDLDVGIKVDMWKGLNGRPYQRYVDNNVDLTAVNQDSFNYDWLIPQMSDDSINFTAMQDIQNRWANLSYDVAFYMESPGRIYETFIEPNYCYNVSLFALNTPIGFTVKTKIMLLNPGESVTIPSNTTHRITTFGHAPSIWYYVFDCHVSMFHQAQMYLSVKGWRYAYRRT